MGEIKISNINKNNNSIKINFETTIPVYFRENYFEAIYNFETSKIPDSIAVIPLIVNILPIVWLTNSKLRLTELDEDFFYSINEFKQGYIDMYPMIDFGGEVVVEKLIKNNNSNSSKVALFFSGGVDAFSSLLGIKDKNPDLITIWGSDVATTNVKAWEKVEKHIKKTSEDFQLNYHIIQSNFRTFIYESVLDQLVINSGDGYWHGFQHGIGLIGLAAPLVFKKQIKEIYIASSYTEELYHTCASAPTIDNYIRFCGCSVIHYQYELSRQDKIKKICTESDSLKNHVSLRVCWESCNGDNCCSCEKCYRTISGIWAEGKNPNDYGFAINSDFYKKIINDLTKKIVMSDIVTGYWKEIQEAFISNSDIIKEKKFRKWICKVNMDTFAYEKQNNPSIWKKGKRYLKRLIK